MSPGSETEEVVKPKRVQRKRVPKPASEDAVAPAPVRRVARTTTPRKRVPKKVTEVVEELVVNEATSPVKRKAPTPIASSEAEKKRSRRQMIIIAVTLLTGIGASAAVGYTDKGQIDVESTIAFRNEQFRSSGNESMVIPVQNSPQFPNGGLVGLPPDSPELNQEIPVTDPEVASTTQEGTESGDVPVEESEVESNDTEASPVVETAQESTS